MNIASTKTPATALQGLKDLQAKGHAIIMCYGAGVDSTAMMFALEDAGIRPDLCTFADTGAEKAETYRTLHTMNSRLLKRGLPLVLRCKKQTLDSTPYGDLGGNCSHNETLPSLAFGMKSCSIKWKQGPQDYVVMGCKSGPNKREPHQIWIDAQRTGLKPVKLIGYDSSPADIRRSKKVKTEDDSFLYSYPLQDLGWSRPDCVERIKAEGFPVPIKSACFFCPASQKWELWWLAGSNPAQFMEALAIEHKAMLGRHSRWGSDETTYDEEWLEFVQQPAKQWPTMKITVGLGRKFAWNRWAVENGLVNWVAGKPVFIGDTDLCLARATELQAAGGNAHDRRTC